LKIGTAFRDRILFFDGVCNLCCGLVKFIIRKDRRGLIKFVPLQSEAAGNILKEAGVNAASLNSVAYLSGGKFYYKSQAIFQILQDMGGLWKSFLIFKIIPRSVSDAVYDFIAKHRYKVFGKKEMCELELKPPNPPRGAL
jgi:predicted DCC family thiol-disulfide oxidoreductase YuxK